MRPGEILALRVSDVEDSVVRVEQRVYQGKLDSPKDGRASGPRGQSPSRRALPST
jgi:hypothetical protein